MTGKTLLATFDSVYMLALAAWVGGIAFFSFGVAPIIFKVLKPESAGSFVRALFPRYYAWGAICGAVALPCLVCGALAVPELRGYATGAQTLLLIVGTLIMLYCGNVLTPAINKARDEGPGSKDRFDLLHHRSVTLNSLVLLLGISLIVWHVNRRPLATRGIVPAESGRVFLTKLPDHGG